ncbi:helitron_like_N domain-containing protein [Trichonephila clavipes]|nr:helitron_like_N domain-containing protein [Trichonephila clavipes]
MLQQLPHQLDEDQVFNVYMKTMIHKSTYLSSMVTKSVVKAWLHFFLCQSLCKQYKITKHWDSFLANTKTSCVAAKAIGDDTIKHLQCDRSAPESEVLFVILQSARLGWNIPRH